MTGRSHAESGVSSLATYLTAVQINNIGFQGFIIFLFNFNLILHKNECSVQDKQHPNQSLQLILISPYFGSCLDTPSADQTAADASTILLRHGG